MDNNNDINIDNSDVLTNLDEFDLSDIVPGDDAILVGDEEPMEQVDEDDKDEQSY